MPKARIIYASMTGNTEAIAEMVSDHLLMLGVDVETSKMESASPMDFLDADICVVATYTYGYGDLPDEAQNFYNQLSDVDLSGKVFGVIGSGDTSYGDVFCKAVDDFIAQFQLTNAKQGTDGVKIEFGPDGNSLVAIMEFAQQLQSSL